MVRPKTTPPRGLLKTAVPPGQPIAHARYHPPPDLEPFVEHFWSVQWDLRGLPPHSVETLPHPSVHLVFERGGSGRILGVARGKFVTQLEGLGGVFSAKFRPGGFSAFVREPMTTFTDATATVGDVWGPDGDGLERAVLAQHDDGARIEVVASFLRQRRPRQNEQAALVATIVDGIAADLGLLSVEDIARRFGLNRRTLQRLFARFIGVNPKWVIQRYRLHEAAERLAQGPVDQAALGFALGYADQAHFVNDFKATVGVSPAAYARRAV